MMEHFLFVDGTSVVQSIAEPLRLLAMRNLLVAFGDESEVQNSEQFAKGVHRQQHRVGLGPSNTAVTT